MRDGNWIGLQPAIIAIEESDNDRLAARRKLFYLVQDGKEPWRAWERKGQKLKAPRVLGPKEWWSGPYEESEFYRGNLGDWGTPATCGEWGGMEFGWRELRECLRGEQGAAAPATDTPPPAPEKHGGGRPPEYDWHALAGEALRLHHLRGISTADRMIRELTKLLESRGEKAPSRSQFYEYVPKWLRQNRPYDDRPPPRKRTPGRR